MATKIYHSSAGLCPKTGMSSYLFCNSIQQKIVRIWNNFNNSVTCKVNNEGPLDFSYTHMQLGKQLTLRPASGLVSNQNTEENVYMHFYLCTVQRNRSHASYQQLVADYK